MPDTERALVLTIQTALTDAGRDRIGDRTALTLTDRLEAITTATVTIADGAIRVEGKDTADDRVISYELGRATGYFRQGRFADHRAATVNTIRVPARKVAPASWLLPPREAGELCVHLESGLRLRASAPLGLRVSGAESRAFWGDLFWLQPRDDDPGYWSALERFGLPQRVTLEDAVTGATLVEIGITAVTRAAAGPLGLEGCRFAEVEPMTGSLPGQLPMPGPGSYAAGTGAGEHVGWIIGPSIVKEPQQLVNEIAQRCGEFDQHDWQGQLIVDWYDRAAAAFGTTELNAFTRIREILKTAIAMYVLPRSFALGQIPPEMAATAGPYLQSLYADANVPKDQRWCTFLNGLKQSPPEDFGPPGSGLKEPTEADHHNYRQKVLLELVDDVLRKRYGTVVVPRPDPAHYGCWAFNADAYNMRMSMRPGAALLENVSVTAQGLCLDVALEQVVVDFEYSVEPAGSPGNVALCIFSLGFANVVESQFGSGTLQADDVLLSVDLAPVRKGDQIKLEAKLGSASHAKLTYLLHGSNIFTLGLAEIGSFVANVAQVGKGEILDAIEEKITTFVTDLDLSFPDLFHFNDAPAPELDTAVVASNPGNAQLIGARLMLPADRAPAAVPALTMPTCDGDYAITLSIDYLNGVLAHRLAHFSGPPPSFDWKQHMSGADLPNVTLPEGYKPKFGEDWEETHEEWTFGPPSYAPITLKGLPGLNYPIGIIHVPVTYRLTRTHYGWGLHLELPKPTHEWQGPKWGPGPPVHREEVPVDLDEILTVRYGMYRQADGQIISPPPRGVTELAPPHINPSPGWHALDVGVGGFVVEWYPRAVATDEHINVHLDATLPAHLNLTDDPAFLPELDLTYGTLSVVVKKADYSASFAALRRGPDPFSPLAQSYLEPFTALHPFEVHPSPDLRFEYPYPGWLMPICGAPYLHFVPNGTKETPLLLAFTIITMIDEADPKKLHIEQDGGRVKLTWRFLEHLAG